MTTSPLDSEVSKRRGRGAGSRVTGASAIVSRLRELRAAKTEIRFPSDRYRNDPVAFFREILGVEPWSRQVDILHAVRDHDRVAVKSGRRVSKSHSVAGIALWWYCSYPDARVIMSSTTARQVDQILWRELSLIRAKSGRCLACKIEDPDGFRIPAPCPHSAKIEGEIGQLARTGLKAPDFREIVGFTARQAEAIQGIAGSRLLFIIDEASGVPQIIFDAIEGNRAGGGKAILFGNPTRNVGEFFDAFHTKALDPKKPDKPGYYPISISSEESPNVVSGKNTIPGLATRSYIRDREIEWGRDSAMFRIHVLGEFALAEEGRIFSVHAIEEAIERWHETHEAGRLYIGLDPAGESGMGDETMFAVRRGLKLLALIPMRGLNDEQHLVQALDVMRRYALPRETPVLVYDREGSIGSALQGKIRDFLDRNPNAFDSVAIRASDRAVRNPRVYDRMRDELAANLEAWVRDGGSIIDDPKLVAEMHTLEWDQHINGRLKITPKDKIRKDLGRSPDRYDALALSCWEPLSLQEGVGPSAQAAMRQGGRVVDAYETSDAGIDPYSGAMQWK